MFSLKFKSLVLFTKIATKLLLLRPFGRLRGYKSRSTGIFVCASIAHHAVIAIFPGHTANILLRFAVRIEVK